MLRVLDDDVVHVVSADAGEVSGQRDELSAVTAAEQQEGGVARIVAAALPAELLQPPLAL